MFLTQSLEPDSPPLFPRETQGVCKGRGSRDGQRAVKSGCEPNSKPFPPKMI